MKILSMTATFGKLEHQTLTLKPGLNIVHAPNEWGKSTWCAFLVAMLYGIETSARTTKAALADKERYAPWSGSPMSGRMELDWNGKNITIERHTKGRLILGEFRAYETDSGIDIPELSAANCGQTLLGVERSVFLRSGFLRLSDLPVTQDDALRRRLNNLVTTGDESGTGDKLAQKLKDLKNKCRYNRSGLLPQAEAQQELLQRKLSQLQELSSQQEKTLARQEQLTDMIGQLENHKLTLEYAASQEDARRVTQAQQARNDAETAYQAQLQRCEALPASEESQQALHIGRTLQQQYLDLQQQLQSLPAPPQPPLVPEQYQSQTPQEAVHNAETDYAAQQTLENNRKKLSRLLTLWTILGGILCVGLAAATFLLDLNYSWIFAGLVLLTAGIFVYGTVKTKRVRSQLDQLYLRHSGIRPDQWVRHAADFAAEQEAYAQVTASDGVLRKALAEKQAALSARIEEFTQGLPLQDALDYWQQACDARDTLETAHRSFLQAQKHAEALQAVVKPVAKPERPDTLNASMDDTLALLDRAKAELQMNQHRAGQLQGQSEALGLESDLRQQLKAISARIEKLEDTYQALELALRALAAASNELQRRFAPRISKRAQELFSKLTGGKYPRLSLGEDLSLSTAADNEDILRSSQWRSDGTADQLYLALRLAVSEELTPDAPLVLDDALVRFDDVRLAQALDILKEEAQTKQVILFTCQSREEKLV